MTASALLKKVGPAVAEPSRESRGESLRTLMFGWHPWHPLENRKTHGVRFGMPGEYATLPRMELLYLPALEVPKLRPKNNGFAVGKVTEFGISASAAVGSDVEIRPQYASQLAGYLKKAYGDRGFTVLDSLTAETDEEKEESILVYKAVMETRPKAPDGEVPPPAGREVVMEDLPVWLDEVAPECLRQALDRGVTVEGKKYTLRPGALDKGTRLIAELKRGIAVGNQAALAVLKKTKKELAAAHKGVNDSKAIEDARDEFFLGQHPSFSLDTEVERAGRAAQNAAKEMNGLGFDVSVVSRLLEQNERLMAENARLAAGQSKSN